LQNTNELVIFTDVFAGIHMRFILLFICALLVQCSALSKIGKDKNRSLTPEELAQQELFDPDDLPDPFVILPPSFGGNIMIQAAGIEQSISGMPSDSTVVDSSKVEPGYRIQIFFTDSYIRAQEALLNAMASILNQPVHLSFDAPYYKIRVGNFLNRDEAENFLNNTLKNSFPDAWIVRTMVFPYQTSPNLLINDSLLYGDSAKVKIDTTRFSPDIDFYSYLY